MTILFANNASTTVAGSIASTDTTVTLQSGTIFPHPLATGDYFVATFYDQVTKTLNEIVHVTNLTGNVATIVRGQEGTTPLAWNSGDIFANLVTAGTLQAFLQQGATPINTTDVYVGDDVSLVPNHIVCNTIPIPSAYALGMVFVIRVKNGNTGPTDCSFNGVAALLAKRTDGSDLVAGDIIAAQEYLFVYNGTFFSTTLMPVPLPPPVTTFYVRSDSTSVINNVTGIESNSGFYNTPQDAYKSLQGAVTTFKARYIATPKITVRVADGTYAGGFQVLDNYVGTWTFIGNTSNPANCVINATASSIGAYDNPQAPVGICVDSNKTSNIDVSGFMFNAGGYDIYSAGYVAVHECRLTAPTGNSSAIGAGQGGTCFVYGNISYSQSIASSICVFDAGANGHINLASPGVPLTIQTLGAYTLNEIALAYDSASMSIYDPWISCVGYQCNAAGWAVGSGGGIDFYGGNQGVFSPIASRPNVIQGGWVS